MDGVNNNGLETVNGYKGRRELIDELVKLLERKSNLEQQKLEAVKEIDFELKQVDTNLRTVINQLQQLEVHAEEEHEPSSEVMSKYERNKMEADAENQSSGSQETNYKKSKVKLRMLEKHIADMRIICEDKMSDAIKTQENNESLNTELKRLKHRLGMIERLSDINESTEHAPEDSHVTLIQKMYGELSETIDTIQIAMRMLKWNALNMKDIELIQSKHKDSLCQAAELLLKILMKRPRVVYECFLDVLKEVGQNSIYIKLIQGNCTDEPQEVEHVRKIRQHYVFLWETLDTKYGLTGRLFADGVLSAAEKDEIDAAKECHYSNEKLLSVLCRKSPEQFDKFLEALDKTGQRHVRKEIGRDDFREVQTLPEGAPVWGVTSLDDNLYVLRQSKQDQLEIYDVTTPTYSLKRKITIPRLKGVTGMASCSFNQCVYISDFSSKYIHRVQIQRLEHDILSAQFTKWSVYDESEGVSVKSDHNVLVTCDRSRKLKTFTTHGEFVDEINLQSDINNPWHSIQLSPDRFVVCHGSKLLNDPINRVCVVNAAGKIKLWYRGAVGPEGSRSGLLDLPCHMAVDQDQFIYVVDGNNKRILLLSPELQFVREILSRGADSSWKPRRLCLDVSRRLLYIAENQMVGDKFTNGRVTAVKLWVSF